MSAASPARVVALDIARGAAVVAMVAFHLIWDLGNFGYIDRDFPCSVGVKLFGHSIAIAFLFIVGLSLVLARARGAGLEAFWRRFFLIAGAAGLVSLGTHIVFPQAFVFFGILHCIALASLLAAPLLALRWQAALIVAALASLAPLAFSHPFFNPIWLSWIGLSTIEPLTNDYRPILPWSAAVFAGVAAAKFWAARGWRMIGENLDAGPLAWLGRHSLALYLLHQPLLFGVFAALAFVGAAPSDRSSGDFVGACVAQCEASGGESSVCREACACTAERAASEDLPTEAKARVKRLDELARDCLAKER
jgi:uncharacterized membrane protein